MWSNSSKISITCASCVLFKKALLSSKTVSWCDELIIHPEGSSHHKITKAWIKIHCNVLLNSKKVKEVSKGCIPKPKQKKVWQQEQKQKWVKTKVGKVDEEFFLMTMHCNWKANLWVIWKIGGLKLRLLLN